jgi:hypothetical protein
MCINSIRADFERGNAEPTWLGYLHKASRTPTRIIARIATQRVPRAIGRIKVIQSVACGDARGQNAKL